MSFSGTLAVTQTVLRSAMVISGAVTSFQNAPGATSRLDHAAGHRRDDRHRARLIGRVGVDTDILQACLGALQLHLSGAVVRFDLLQILLGRPPLLAEDTLAIPILEGERNHYLRSVIVSIGSGKIGRVDDDERLARFHPLAKLHLELRRTTSERRQDLDQVGRIGLHDRRENQAALDVLLLDGLDCERCPHRRPIGNSDPLPRADERLHLLDGGRCGCPTAEWGDVQPISAGAGGACDQNKRQNRRPAQPTQHGLKIAGVAKAMLRRGI